jgi:hypothetical protein
MTQLNVFADAFIGHHPQVHQSTASPYNVSDKPQEIEDLVQMPSDAQTDHEEDEMSVMVPEASENVYISTENVALSSVQQSELSDSSGRGTQFTDAVCFQIVACLLMCCRCAGITDDYLLTTTSVMPLL